MEAVPQRIVAGASVITKNSRRKIFSGQPPNLEPVDLKCFNSRECLRCAKNKMESRADGKPKAIYRSLEYQSTAIVKNVKSKLK